MAINSFGEFINPVMAMQMPDGTTGNTDFVSSVGPENPVFGPMDVQPEHLGEPFRAITGIPIQPSLPIHAVDPFQMTHGAVDYGIKWDRG